MGCTRWCFFVVLLLNLNTTEIKSFGPSLDCDCGVDNKPLNNRIIGGLPVIKNEYPWLVEISLNHSLYCGGSIINNRFVLTAGHCVDGIDPASLEVILGRHNRKTSEGIRMQIERVYMHDNYTSHTHYDENDLALLKLDSDIRFSKVISPVCLPHPRSKYGGLSAFVIGWGRIYPHRRKMSDVVLKGEVTVLHDFKCKKSRIAFGYTIGNICAYRSNVDACQGDSGSPLIYLSPRGKHEIIGVVSWGLDCALEGNPGVYVAVTHYVRWILNITENASYCRV